MDGGFPEIGSSRSQLQYRSRASWVTFPDGSSTRRFPRMQRAERRLSWISPALAFCLITDLSFVVYLEAAHPDTMLIA
jgi:hypothetical protein